MANTLAACKLLIWCSPRHEYTARTSHEILMLETSSAHESGERDLLLMPVWKRLDGQEIIYVVHPNRAVTREVFEQGVKMGTRYAGEFRPVDYEPWLLFINYLPTEHSNMLEGLKCTQPAHRGHSPQYGFLPEDYAGGYLRNNWELLNMKLSELALKLGQQ
ncbi:hypothetical protein DICVIV_08172 [Dictyocaulus viviparus]|uniref:Uncharacterized protein n=1 Tax=Dictyocaulus viviparus TaxID=29172 RepID=A0A0D8XTT5_DICVI|nr:hypothetical protein DICVIV_08172 [Dictyocaulus viviparus]